MNQKSEIPNLYRPNYIKEREFERESRRLITFKGGELSYKIIFGNRKELLDEKVKLHANNVIDEVRKYDFKQIVKHHDLLFNPKQSIYNKQYLDNVYYLLNKNDKNYVLKRKILTKRVLNKIKLDEPEICKQTTSKKESFVTNLLSEYMSTRKNRNSSVNLSLTNRNESVKNSYQIISPVDEEFENYDDKLKYNKERISIHLKRKYNFFPSPKNKANEKFLKKKEKIFKLLDPPEIELRLNRISTLKNIKLKKNNSTGELIFFNKNNKKLFPILSS